jgi:hypothetical protein
LGRFPRASQGHRHPCAKVDWLIPNVRTCRCVRDSADERSQNAPGIYGCSVTDPRWTLLQEMEPALLQAFRESGVTRIEYVAAFPSQDDAWVWLGTETDAERDALAGSEPQVLSEVRLIAERHGFSAENVSGVTVQSEETVARDFEGSWFYALR